MSNVTPLRTPDTEHKFRVSYFKNARNPNGECLEFSMATLLDLIRHDIGKIYPEKTDMPMIKLAKFKGDKRAGTNLIEVHGIEADYDGCEMTINEAESRITRADIRCILYHTPTSTVDKPKWRVFAPFRQPLLLDECGGLTGMLAARSRHSARLNGILGGVFAVESDAAGQGFFVGVLKTSKCKDVLYTESDGLRWIDEADDLDTGAMPVRTGDGGYSGKADNQDFKLLRLDTPLKDLSGETKELRDWLSEIEGGGKVRIGSPFRADSLSKDPAFLKLDPEGFPMIHDMGNATTYKLSSIDHAEFLLLTGRNIEPLIPGNYTTIVESANLIYPLLASTNRVFWHAGTPSELNEAEGRFIKIGAAAFRSTVEHYTRMKTVKLVADRNSPIPVRKYSDLSGDSANALLAAREARTHLPPVKLLTRVPLLLNTEGKPTLAEQGYNPVAGGVYVFGNIQIEQVPVEKAALSLMKLLEGFLFMEEADKSRAVAMLITPELQAGGFFGNECYCPMMTTEADKSQTGKTLLQKIRAALYGDEVRNATVKSFGIGSFDEAISELFLSGSRFGNIDNVRGKIDSPLLEMAITSPKNVPCRVAYKGERMVDISSMSLGMSSNGVNLTRDQANRTCMIRIKKQARDYKFPVYKEGSILDHIMSNVGYYLGCIHSIIREWVKDGMQREAGIGHDFHQWAGTVQYICDHYFNLCDPMLGHERLQERTSSPVAIWLRSVCNALESSNQLDEKLNATDIAVTCVDAENIAWPGKEPEPNTAPRMVGMYFKRLFSGNDHEVIDVDVADEIVKIEVEGFDVYRRKEYNELHYKDTFVYVLRKQVAS